MLVVRTGTNFEWQMSTKIVFGVGAINGLGERAKSLGMHKPMVVTDKGIANTDGFKAAMRSLEASGVEAFVWAAVQPDPPDTSIHEGEKEYTENKCDGLIGFGGGSSMDTAKAIGVVALNGHSVNDYYAVDADKRPITKMPPLICIPTTAGTASEVTLYSVVTNTVNHQKFAIADPLLYARVALLDPTLTYSLPAGLTASTGLDTLCHAIGGYTSNQENPVCDALLLYAIELVSKNLRRAVYVPRDTEARTNMLMASLLGGMGFSNSSPTLDHAIGQSLGAVFHLFHGLACSLTLPECLEFVRPARMEKMVKLAEAFGVTVTGMSEEEASKAAIAQIDLLMADIRIPSLREATGGAMSEADMEKVATMSMRDLNTRASAMPISAKGYVEILRKANAKEHR